MTEVLAMTLGMAVGGAGGVPLGRTDSGVVPVMRYADGAWIGRVTTPAGWARTILPLWRRGTKHWTAVESPGADFEVSEALIGDQILFVYIDPNGHTQGVIMIGTPDRVGAPDADRLRVKDAGGDGLGVIEGIPLDRLLGFLYGAVLPEDYNPIDASIRPKLPAPIVLADSTFKRKKTGTRVKLRQLVDSYPNRVRELTSAADSLMKAKKLRPWGWEPLQFDHNLHGQILRFVTRPMRFHMPGQTALGVAVHLNPTWAEFDRNYGRVLTPDQRQALEARRTTGALPPKWTAYLYRSQRHSDAAWTPFAFLGFSDIGPFEALVDAGFFVSTTQLDAWLEAHVDFTGVPRSSLEAYDLLDEPSPLTWSLDRFRGWANALPAEW